MNTETEANNDKRIIRFGDEHSIEVPNEPIDCSDYRYFDDLEYDCWDLVKKYCGAFGIKLIPDDEEEESSISFDVAKDIQDHVIKLFEEVGLEFKFTPDVIMTPKDTMQMGGM